MKFHLSNKMKLLIRVGLKSWCFILLICLPFLLFSSCSQKKEESFTISRAGGYKVTHYAQALSNNWKTTSGLATYLFKGVNAESPDGNLTISYSNFKTNTGNCSGSITGEMTESSASDLPVINNGTSDIDGYDIMVPYEDPNSAVENNILPEEVFNRVYLYKTDSYTLSGCPFSGFSSNYLVVTLYPNGDMIVTDWSQALDFFLRPN